eukprot:SAG22_NODE_1349_length_4655_cov_6.900132_5_plen_199_part_00
MSLGFVAPSVRSLAQPADALGPGCLLPLPVKLALAAPGMDKEKEKCSSFTVTVSGVGAESGARLTAPPVVVWLRCRRADQPFLFTFVDHDGSVAHAGAIKPRAAACPAGGCAVYLSMAGVGVKPLGQAESHKAMAKGETEFAFGYKKMWVLAPERDGTWPRTATRDLCPFACHLKASLFASWTTKARTTGREPACRPR